MLLNIEYFVVVDYVEIDDKFIAIFLDTYVLLSWNSRNNKKIEMSATLLIPNIFTTVIKLL